MLGSNRNQEERSDDSEAKPRWREAPDTWCDSMITVTSGSKRPCTGVRMNRMHWKMPTSRGGLAGRGCGRFPFHFVGLVDTLTSSRVCTVFESRLKTFSGEFTWQHLWQELWCYVIAGKYVTFKACYFSFSSKVNGFPFWGGYLFSFRVKVNVFYYCKSRKICYF